MPTLRIPLIGNSTSRDDVNTRLFGSSQKDQYFKDCHFHVVRNSVTGQSATWVSARDGFFAATYPSSTSGEGTAIRYWRGHTSPGLSNVLSAWGNTNSTIYYESTSLGSITGQCIFISETAISNEPTAVFVSSGNRAYYYGQTTATLTEITDTDFPPKQGTPLTITGNFAHIDGYAMIMCTNGQIWHSDVNSLANWTSSANITAQEYPDPGIGLARYKNLVVAFSKGSIEFFQNAGNTTGAVLSRVQPMVKKIGCIGQYAYCEINDTIAWVGSESGQVGVYVMNGGEARKISNADVQLNLENIATTNTRLNVMYSRGKTYLALTTAKSATGLYVYDFETDIWHQWVLPYGLTQSDSPGAGINGVYYLGDDEDNYLFNSLAVAVTAEIQTAPVDMGTLNKKRIKKVRLVGDRASVTSTVSLSWSDDDYQTYSSARTISMQTSLPQARNCGTTRRRGFKLSGIGNSATTTRLRLEAIEIEYEVDAL